MVFGSSGMHVLGLMLLVLGVQSKVDDVNVGGNGFDHVQEEILTAMKNSGVLDEMKDKLDDMLYNEEETKEVKKETKKSMINDQEREMLKTFIDEYKEDSNAVVSTDLVLNILDKVQKTPKPNLPQLFVHLGPVIDVLSKISESSSDVQKIIDRQAPLFNSPAKPKDILHTLAENLKSELNRLRPQQQKKQQKQADSGLGLMDYISLGSTMLKGGNGAEMLSLLSGGDVDITSMLKMLPDLLEGDDYKTLLPKMIKSYASSTPMGAMVTNLVEQNLDTPEARKTLEFAFDEVRNFVKSKNYDKIISTVNTVLQAKNTEEMAKILVKEAEKNWDLFFENIKNEDFKENYLDTLAYYVVQAYDFYESIPSNSIAGQSSMFINAFLMSQQLPAYSPKKPLESVIKIGLKAWKLYSPMKEVDLAPYVAAVSDALSQAYESQSGGNKFYRLSRKEKQSLVSRLIDAELVTPVHSVWRIYTKTQTDQHCAAHLLCLINSREVSQGSGPARQAVLKGSSMVGGWAMSKGYKEAYWSLYKAVWAGVKGEDCHVKYPVQGHSCDVFDWQTEQMMNPGYDHIEL